MEWLNERVRSKKELLEKLATYCKEAAAQTSEGSERQRKAALDQCLLDWLSTPEVKATLRSLG
ncbi:MAG: hypothetical protein ACTSRL_03950, partial [Candidatus Helarchaeota archaeon]